jgi:hypothetical protein
MLTVGSSTDRGGSASTALGVAQGVGDVQSLDAGEGDDVAGRGLGHLDALQAQEAEDLQDAAIAALALRSTTVTGVLVLTRPRVMRPMPMTPT